MRNVLPLFVMVGVFFSLELFAGPGQINIPKDQPGYSTLSSASRGAGYNLVSGKCTDMNCRNERACSYNNLKSVSSNQLFFPSSLTSFGIDEKYCGRCCWDNPKRCVRCCYSILGFFNKGEHKCR
jgi:hypothetical protein